MPRFQTDLLKPGDVLVTRSDGFFPRIIRLGQALVGSPNTVNHAIIAHHYDDAGTFWGIEGRPGGVGWVDLTDRVSSPFTNANVMQAKDAVQRAAIVKLSGALLGTPYDWAAIAADGMRAIRAQRLWKSKDYEDGKPPAHVVCSSYADWVYHELGLPSPSRMSGVSREVTPGDWETFIVEEGWK